MSPRALLVLWMLGVGLAQSPGDDPGVSSEDIEADPVLVAGSTDSVDVLGSVAVVGSPEPADPLLDDLEPDPSATH